MHKLPTVLAGLAAFAVPQMAAAHHGFAAHFYPDRVVRIEGRVSRFDFINPHGFLYIDAVGDDCVPSSRID